MKRLLAILALILVLTAPAWAATELKHTVKPSGGDFTTLGAAIDHLEASHSNLVTADVYATIKIDGDWTGVSDTSYSWIHNITTDATHYIYIYTTAAARHKGIPSTSYYNIKANGYGIACVEINCSNVTVEGLQAWNTCGYGDPHGFRIRGVDNVIIRSCIGRADMAIAGHGFMDDDNATNCLIYNCLAYDCGGYGFMVHKTAMNCTAVHNTHEGFLAPYWAATYTNCLGHGNGTADFGRAGTETLTLNNCASADGTADDFSGTGDRATQIFTFVNHDGDDFHLGSTDAGARNYGTDLSVTFTTDIDGETRPTGAGTWDIGMDEYIAPPSSMINNVLIIIGRPGRYF